MNNGLHAVLTSQEYDGDVNIRMTFFELPTGFKTAHTGHIHVHEDKVRLDLLYHGNSRQAILSGLYLIALLRQDNRKQLAIVFLVLYDKDLGSVVG